MPDDRLLHRSLGHSEKVNRLTDAERLVWIMYKLAADDFGIMRFSAAPLQAAAEFLEKRTAKAVMAALETVREVGLVQPFEHQGSLYIYQWDWQTWQKITHPRQTKQPKPPADLLASCDLNTRWLFSHHPKGGKLPSWQDPSLTGKKPAPRREDTGSPPGEVPAQTGPVLVGSVGVGDRDRVGVSGAPPTARLAFGGKVLEVPKFLDAEFVKRLNGQYFDLTAFYLALDARLAETGEPWDLRWVRDRFAAESPLPARSDERPITPSERTKAENYRRAIGYCPHSPKCETGGTCIATIVRAWREEERAVLRG